MHLLFLTQCTVVVMIFMAAISKKLNQTFCCNYYLLKCVKTVLKEVENTFS